MMMTDVDFEVKKIDTGIMGADEKDSLLFTVRAIEKVNAIRQENSIPEEYSLRLGTQSGGCSGMNYILGFDSEINDYDKPIELDKINLVIDRTSLFYLQGVTLDYVDDINGSGFIFTNPNNIKSCGCGGH